MIKIDLIEKVKKYILSKKKYFENLKFKKETSRAKKKLYIIWENKVDSFKSSRNKFKIFKTKLEFENTFKNIKKVNLYYYLIWIFLILATWYVVVFSHYFSVKSVDVIRNDDLINIDLAYRSIENVRLKPMIFIDKSEIKNSILWHQPNIKDITIRKIYPSNIKIVLGSYKWLYDVKIEWRYFKVTENGVFVPTKEIEEDKDIMRIVWLDSFWVMDYKKIIDEQQISKIKEIQDLIKWNNSFLNIKELVYYKKERELHVIDEKWIRYIFDLTKEVPVQVEKLNIFYKQYLNKIKYWIVYIDLRINEKIIYCSTQTEFQCKENLKSVYSEE